MKNTVNSITTDTTYIFIFIKIYIPFFYYKNE